MNYCVGVIDDARGSHFNGNVRQDLLVRKIAGQAGVLPGHTEGVRNLIREHESRFGFGSVRSPS
jgi:hypothetical protein